MFFNGLGGFTPTGASTSSPPRRARSRRRRGSTCWPTRTSAPWSPRAAGLHLGENAHEFRLTPWHNDPVSDTGGEAFYLRDEETGHFWSPTPLPCRGVEPYVTRHGFGYSVFEHSEDGIHSEVWVYVAIDAPVKFTVLKLAQRFRPRAPALRHRLRRMGAGRSAAENGDARRDRDRSGSGALFARNAYNTEFADRVAFFDVDETARTRDRRPHGVPRPQRHARATRRR